MTPEEIAAAWKLVRRGLNYISPLEVAQLRDFLEQALRAIDASQQSVAQARLDALEEAAKQVCIPCRLGKFKVRVWRGFYRHINDQGHVFQDCDADRIWLLINGANESEGSGE